MASLASKRVSGRRVKQKKKKPQAERPPVKKKKKEESDEEYHTDDSEDYSQSEDEGNSGYRKGGYHRVHVGDVYNQKSDPAPARCAQRHLAGAVALGLSGPRRCCALRCCSAARCRRLRLGTT
jgi:hypothetical protein